jgi:hypothetical protein
MRLLSRWWSGAGQSRSGVERPGCVAVRLTMSHHSAYFGTACRLVSSDPLSNVSLGRADKPHLKALLLSAPLLSLPDARSP